MKFLDQVIFRTPIATLKGSLPDDVFMEALYISSPVLYHELLKYRQGELSHPKEVEKLIHSLYKYQSRAATRPTPYGLFAGVGVLNWGSENNVRLDAELSNTLRRKTRLDMNITCQIADYISGLDFIKPYLKYYPNNSIYKIGDSYRYVEFFYNGSKRLHKLSKVQFSEYLQLILEESKKGPGSDELAALLVNDEIGGEEASAFINELIDSQILVSQLEPNVTGEDFFERILNEIHLIAEKSAAPPLALLLEALVDLDACIKRLDEEIVNPVAAYKDIYLKLKRFLPSVSETNLFQTDLYKKTVAATIDRAICDNIKEGLNFLNKISQPSAHPHLEEFVKRFRERYEDQEVPLLAALDSESGIGYPSRDDTGINELVDDLGIGSGPAQSMEIKWNNLEAVLHKLLINCFKESKKVIELNEKEFSEVDYSTVGFAPSFAVMFKVVNASTNKIRLNNVGGSSAVNMLGRFAGGSEEMKAVISQITEHENSQFEGRILAEIAHLPENRTGNILARPSFRQYEIPYLAKSTLARDFQIQPEDLYVSVKGSRIILKSRRLQKEVIPKLGNAHNFQLSTLPVYRFLCDMQSHYIDKKSLSFSWGALAGQYKFLPRVEFKNMILSPAKWQLTSQHFGGLTDKQKGREDKLKLFKEFKEQNDLPDLFLLVEGDNELLIDTANDNAVMVFIGELKGKNFIRVEEFLFEGGKALASDTGGNEFSNECLAFVLADNKIESQVLPERRFTTEQNFSIGSEWLYYKIYTGIKTADMLLAEKLKPLADELCAGEMVQKWFFIRYADPDPHIRFRLLLTDKKHYGAVLEKMHAVLKPLMDDGLVFSVKTDTYKRELARYGNLGIELAESLFYNDSCFVCDFLNLLDTESGGALRWQMALRSIDEFLEDFGLSDTEKFDLISFLSEAFFKEHGGRKGLKVRLDDKFRRLRKSVEEVMDKKEDELREYFPVIELLQRRSVENRKVIERLRKLSGLDASLPSLQNLIASYMHMNLTRLFLSRNRLNEFVCYDLLTRHYRSVLAREKAVKKKQAGILTN